MSSSRSFRLETRSRARDEIRKIVQTVDKVRKWEKKWVDLGLSNSVKVYKWVPVREDPKDEEEDKDVNELTDDNTSSIDVGILSTTSSLVQELRPTTESLPTNILDDEPPSTEPINTSHSHQSFSNNTTLVQDAAGQSSAITSQPVTDTAQEEQLSKDNNV